jgi:hypothetical protein
MLISERDPSLDQIKTWSDARLSILDEICFAAQHVIRRLVRKLQELKEKQWKPPWWNECNIFQ